VAHRLPVCRVGGNGSARFAPSPGGVASALSAALRPYGRSGWVGWDGTADGPSYLCERDDRLLAAVPLTRAELELHYGDFANGCLWPLYHGGLRPLVLKRAAWEHHVRVCRRFAEAAASLAAPGGSIWVHDYQLQLVPSTLRALRADLRIGFFLHVPFPDPQQFVELPWRQEVVAGILGADLVGFQTERYLDRFCRAAELIGEAQRVSATQLRSRAGHVVRVGVFPISVDAQRFAEQARHSVTQDRVKTLRAELQGRRVLLGVDRLDYTKGLDVRLAACERLLAQGTLRPREHVLVQVAVPTRENHPHYAALRLEIESQAARIRRRHGSALRLMLGQVDFAELVALYRAADLLVVSPYADGMNLVSKEFVASRIDDSGVLALSRFAGAAEELPEAVPLDPNSVEALSDGLARALSLPGHEERRRMAALRRRVMRADVHDWAAAFLDALAVPVRARESSGCRGRRALTEPAS
jgi:trehalose 6-phosphate synthase